MSTAVLDAAPSSPHAGRIEFGQTRRWRGGWAGSVTVDFDGELYTIELDMIEPYVADMIAFFEEIAHSDWHGTARWSSEFQELAVEASRSGAQVKLAFKLWWSRGDELDNERQGELFVSRDGLPRFAASLRRVTQLESDAARA